MISRRLFFALALAALFGSLTGCETFFSKKPKVQPAKTPSMEDQSGDTSFQAFLGRLRKAASKHDTTMLSSLMSADFGYSWAPGGEGAGVFEYWDKNGLWPELELVLREKFVPSENFMVAPAQATFDPEYKGYRAGLRLVNGGWRFAYFVAAPPAEQ